MQQEKKYGKCPECGAPCEVVSKMDFDGVTPTVQYDEYVFHPQHPGTAIWVKASDRLPGWGTHVKWRLGNGPETNRKIAFSEMNDNNLKDLSKWEWLDESESPSKEGNKEREVAGSSDAVAFHDWVLANEWEINTRAEHTHATEQLYEQFKNRNNEQSV